MKNFLHNKMRGVVTAVATALLALAVAPTAATAAENYEAMTGGSLRVTNVKEGDEVSLYKVVNWTYDKTTNDAKWEFVYDFDIEPENYVENQKEANANKIAAYINDDTHTIADPKSATVKKGETSVTIDGLTSGQYLIQVSNVKDATRVFQNTIESVIPEGKGATYEWPTTNPMFKAELKATDMTKPGSVLDKKIDGKDAIDKKGNGDEVTFTITSLIPVYTAGGRTYTITDVMTEGIDLKEADWTNFDIKVGDQQAANCTLNFANDGKTFTLQFDNLYQSGYGGQTLTITYKGIINNKAKFEADQTNKATLKFSTNSYDDATRTVEDTVSATVYGLKFIKVEEGKTDKTLAGAEFQIVRKDDSKVVATATSGNNGIVTVDGLGAGDYILKETKAPAGYKLPTEDFEFTINSHMDENGHFAGVQYSTEIFANGVVTNAPNTFATNLPETGGAGTLGLTVAGVVAMAAAAAIVIRMRKQD